MAETNLDLAVILARHRIAKGRTICHECGQEYPCDVVALAEGYKRLLAKLEHLVVIQTTIEEDGRVTVNLSAYQQAILERDHVREQKSQLETRLMRYHAVLEGAEYKEIETLGTMPIETCRLVGQEVARMTKQLEARVRELELAAEDCQIVIEMFDKEGIEPRFPTHASYAKTVLAALTAARAEGERLKAALAEIETLIRCEHLDMGGHEKSRYNVSPINANRMKAILVRLNEALATPPRGGAEP